MCIGGEPTHAVQRLPATGEFRIHDHWGGTTEPVEPDAEVLELARGRWPASGRGPHYARVDVLFDGTGPLVVELELVDPYLYFEVAPGRRRPVGGPAGAAARERA